MFKIQTASSFKASFVTRIRVPESSTVESAQLLPSAVEQILKTSVVGGDPYYETAKMAVEASICLAWLRKSLPCRGGYDTYFRVLNL